VSYDYLVLQAVHGTAIEFKFYVRRVLAASSSVLDTAWRRQPDASEGTQPTEQTRSNTGTVARLYRRSNRTPLPLLPSTSLLLLLPVLRRRRLLRKGPPRRCPCDAHGWRPRRRRPLCTGLCARGHARSVPFPHPTGTASAGAPLIKTDSLGRTRAHSRNLFL